MNDAEVRQITGALNELLRKHELSWIIDEVSSVIGEGLQELKQVSFETFDDTGSPSPRKGPKSEATTTRNLTDREQLLLLLSAIRRATVEVHRMRMFAFEKLSGPAANASKMSFRPDVPADFEDKGFSLAGVKQGNPFELTGTEVNRQVSSFRQLEAAISQLEAAINAN